MEFIMLDGPTTIPEVLCHAERASHLARALHDLLQTDQPPAALPALGRIAGVICREACDSAEALGDLLGCEPESARHGGPVC